MAKCGVEDTAQSSGYSTPYKFTGKELDRETGLYYFGARYYDARISRWISADPALVEGKYFPKPNDFDTENDFYWYLNQDGSRKLPGMGGVFNAVNMDVYHYAGLNPVKLVDPDGDYIIDKFTFLETNSKWEIRFLDDDSRSFLNKIKFLPAGSFWLRYLVEHSPFSEFYYDSSMSDSSIVMSTIFDIAGSVSSFGKVVNWIGTVGGIANTAYGNFSDSKQDKYRIQFLKSAGLMNDKYMKGYSPQKLKALMDAVDLSIAYYFDKIEGTTKDKGLSEYAKSLSDTFKYEIIPRINRGK